MWPQKSSDLSWPVLHQHSLKLCLEQGVYSVDVYCMNEWVKEWMTGEGMKTQGGEGMGPAGTDPSILWF